MSKAPLPSATPEEIITDALNEQGYLFQHKLTTSLLANQAGNKTGHSWQLEAVEVPVSLPSGEETRIDIVLRRGREDIPVQAVIECKRSARDYKRWIFFAQSEIVHTPLPSFYYSEKAQLSGTWRQNTEPEPNIVHCIEPTPAAPECPVFDFGVEAKLNWDKRVSSTDAIEGALQQVTLGQAGLGVRLRKSHILNFRILPVVTTTAELMSAHFDARNVSLDRGEIEAKDIKITPRKWLAVNFRIRQSIAAHIPLGLHNKISLAADLTSRQVRTIFVVQSEHIQEFLKWLEQIFPTAA